MTGIGGTLRELRSKAGYTQDAVSKYLGISQPAYVKYENGGTEVSETALDKLSTLYGVDKQSLRTGNISKISADMAFRKTGDDIHLEDIAKFQKIIKNYLEITDELERNR